MKVGDYVRTKNFGIKKILDIGGFLGMKQYLINEDGTYVIDNSIIKSSPNIIDLIEVGDYVNGHKVIDTFTDYIFDYSEEFKVIRFSETDILHDVKHIKSIVTHEQFKKMEFKVGE